MSRPRRRYSLFAAVLLVACSSNDTADHTEHSPAVQPSAAQSTPSTQAASDAAKVNKVLDPAGFSDPQVRAAYEAAKQYAHVLEEIYCYCRCKENIGHRALVECFETDHASDCSVCMNEAIIAARMTKDGRNPKEIQKAIDVLYAG
ncbi:MAG TPA: CYCXC family (seleno)protein [Gemmatimonadaceae bacterium]|nr:CYCXC family (seleno)protein [Gemmatimonadaceae bacterium]